MFICYSEEFDQQFFLPHNVLREYESVVGCLLVGN